MSIFRSEEISHKFMRIAKDQAVEVLSELGKIDDTLEFIDLNKDNPEGSKNYTNLIKRCDEIDRKINQFIILATKFNLSLSKFKNYKDFDFMLTSDIEKSISNNLQYFDYVEHVINEDEKKCNELVNSQVAIKDTLEALIEKKSVYEVCLKLIKEGQIDSNEDSSNLSVIAGVVRTEDLIRMKRMLFRVSKGNVMSTFFDLIEDYNKFDDDCIKVPKKIFVLFFNSSGEEILKSKILKVCDIFQVSRYSIPKSTTLENQINEVNELMFSNKALILGLNKSISNYIYDRIGSLSIPSKYELYKIFVKKEKLIYTTLSKCILRDHFVDAEIYVHANRFLIIQDKLNDMYKNSESKTIPVFENMNTQKRPTLIKTNEFTWIFQEIVNTYGVPRYREVNPALFNIVTFPFLFGIMFGDIGHGGLLLAFGIYLTFWVEEIKKSERMKIFVQARYLILMMGISSFYCGWIYNDFFSMTFDLFSSCYDLENSGKHKNNCVYPFGVDPVWYSSSNELSFMNSLKMKLSVIFGVSQMLLGIVLKGINSWNNSIDMICEVIPQFLFMFLLFGYMNIMIFIKWTVNWSEHGTMKAPSVITLLLNIFLKGGSVDEKPLYGFDEYKPGNTQEIIHKVLFIIALICVPIMLLPKPFLLYWRHKKAQTSMMEEEEDNEVKF